MAQFMVLAHDGMDPDAVGRRMAARDAHIALGDRLVAQGHHLYGAAVLDDTGAMIGSILIVDYPSRAELEQWLAVEPYMTGDVWRDMCVTPVRVGPSFEGLSFEGTAIE
jgi:uncharacterized protein